MAGSSPFATTSPPPHIHAQVSSRFQQSSQRKHHKLEKQAEQAILRLFNSKGKKKQKKRQEFGGANDTQ